MFKIGDKVRFKEAYMDMAPKGTTDVVTGVRNLKYTIGDRNSTYLIRLKNLKIEVFNTRLELMEEGSFNVSTATDQELADEYRRLIALRAKLCSALESRGFSVIAPNGRKLIFVDHVSIVKEERIVTTL